MALGNVKPSDNEAKNKELIQSLRRDLAAANRRLPQQPQQWAPGHQSQRQAVAHVGQQAQSWSSDQVYSSDYAHASQDHRGSGYDGGGPSSATAHGEEYMVANVDTRPGLGRGAVGGGSRGTGGRGVAISTGAGGGRGAGTSTNPTPGDSQGAPWMTQGRAKGEGRGGGGRGYGNYNSEPPPTHGKGVRRNQLRATRQRPWQPGGGAMDAVNLGEYQHRPKLGASEGAGTASGCSQDATK